ncbi:hypothetical protein BX616_005579 [Lobosporangium transversale]|uniref:Uncharacterized protein n=1 Tax=Lobosporangium transversale TaxID=64571 RepID=A0A1Y2GEN7_9FUNG|nr:hypothetical protein BCR41DRAFT_360391 [Lobosporangium transversale]KAF9915699.1 hypothetical protein BX616_005579 [Lobosporangium transversale]ORZ07296.1 hypothetical protein BCR41DRAFT_360391 [Lobosporangium transversale]|eukprot:XP_021877959.1 hypothetical protein BCR41DRAFT_360391 [Lobosporangium transversale]
MAQRLDLSIAPGKHLGWLRLGMSLWDIIRLLRDQAALIPAVELKYSEEDPFAADIVLKLASNGIELRFEPYLQRLKLIHVYDFSRLRLTYKGGEVCSSKALPTFLLINQLIGPTFPGEFDSSNNLYTLSYPGLSLVFPIPEKHTLLYQTSADLPIEFPDGNTPVATHMYIFHGADWITAAPIPVTTLARNIQDSSSPNLYNGRIGENRTEVEKVVARINYGAVLQFPGPMQSQKCLIQLHVTTPQDLLADLGSPGSIYYKEDDKMQIHNDTDGSPQSQQVDDGILGEMEDVGYDRSSHPADGSHQPNDYFYNYFHLGIDVLFDGSTHRCKKIVMHTNIPGHFDFQSYKRCPFVLHLTSPPSNYDAETAKLSSIPSQTMQILPSTPEAMKTTRKKSRGSSTSVTDSLDPVRASYSSTDSPHGSPDNFGSDQDMANNNNMQRQLGGGLTAVSPEKGIFPDMKISTIMALLDPSGAVGGSPSSAGIPNKQGLILNRGSSTQNPFKHTTLYGTDGAVFEAMLNGHVATVTLY